MSEFDFYLRKQEGTDLVCFESRSDKGRQWSFEITGEMADGVFDLEPAMKIAIRLGRAGYAIDVTEIADDLVKWRR